MTFAGSAAHIRPPKPMQALFRPLLTDFVGNENEALLSQAHARIKLTALCRESQTVAAAHQSSITTQLIKIVRCKVWRL
jgi:hypothetical protein